MAGSLFDNVTAWYEEGNYCEKVRLKALLVRNPHTGCCARIDIPSPAVLKHRRSDSFVDVKVSHNKYTCGYFFKADATDAATRAQLLEQGRRSYGGRVVTKKGWIKGELDIYDEGLRTGAACSLAARYVVALLLAMNITELPDRDKMPDIVVRGDPTKQQLGDRWVWVGDWFIDGISTEVHNFKS